MATITGNHVQRFGSNEVWSIDGNGSVGLGPTPTYLCATTNPISYVSSTLDVCATYMSVNTASVVSSINKKVHKVKIAKEYDIETDIETDTAIFTYDNGVEKVKRRITRGQYCDANDFEVEQLKNSIMTPYSKDNSINPYYGKGYTFIDRHIGESVKSVESVESVKSPESKVDVELKEINASIKEKEFNTEKYKKFVNNVFIESKLKSKKATKAVTKMTVKGFKQSVQAFKQWWED